MKMMVGMMKQIMSNISKVPGMILNACNISNSVAIIGRLMPQASLLSSIDTNASTARRYEVVHNAFGKQYIIKAGRSKFEAHFLISMMILFSPIASAHLNIKSVSILYA